MYKVFCDKQLICDSRVEELALTDPVVHLEENKAGSFSFIMTADHPFYKKIRRRTSFIDVYRDGENLFSGICTDVRFDFYKREKINCEGDLSFFNDSIQRPARYQNVTVRGLLEAYVANHNAQVEKEKQFQVGQVTVQDANDSLYCFTNMESTMKALKEDLIDNLGGFFRIRHVNDVRYLDYLKESPNTCSQPIRLGKNLLEFSSNLDSVHLATAIIPLGAVQENRIVEGLDTRLTIESVNAGKDYVFSQAAVNQYGWIYKTVTWDNVTTPEALKQKGEKYLADIQFENVTVKAKAVDLHAVDKSMESFKLSDQIQVISEPHGMNRYFRLTKMKICLNNEEQNAIELGKTERLSLTVKNQQANEEIKKAIERISPNSIVKDAVDNATNLIKAAMNGYVTTVQNPDGSAKELLIMDTPDKDTATKVWRWNINGLAYSSTGYNGPYALAMTMDGAIVADFITAGTMKCNRLKGGVLTLGGINNSSGEFKMQNAEGETIITINNDGIVMEIADGSKIIINPEVGFFQLVGTNKRGYHNLFYTKDVTIPKKESGAGYTETIVQLPDEFKGKEVCASVSIKQIRSNYVPSTFGVVGDCYASCHPDLGKNAVIVSGALSLYDLKNQTWHSSNECLTLTLTVTA